MNLTLTAELQSIGNLDRNVKRTGSGADVTAKVISIVHKETKTMDNSIHIEEFTADKIAALLANPDDLSGVIFSNSDDWKGTDRIAMANHNGWHTIHLLLAGDPWDGEWPLNFMASVEVGTPVSYDEEYPPATFFSSDEVKTISEALQKITPSVLSERFDPDDESLYEVGCGVDVFSSPEEYVAESLVPDYDEIRNFVAAAASRDHGLLVAWTMM